MKRHVRLTKVAEGNGSWYEPIILRSHFFRPKVAAGFQCQEIAPVTHNLESDHTRSYFPHHSEPCPVHAAHQACTRRAALSINMLDVRPQAHGSDKLHQLVRELSRDPRIAHRLQSDFQN